MCNLYSMVSNKEAIREFAKFLRVTPEADNLPTFPAIFADGRGPIVRATDDGSRELAVVRWGVPSQAWALKGKNRDPGTTNLRQLPKWKRYLEPLNRRCVVPITSFAEPDQVGGSLKNHWFAANPERPLMFFAGVWVSQWTSVRKVKDGETTDDLYGFLTTDANSEVAAIHNKAMPVLLRTPEEVDRWFTIAYEQIEDEIQNPLPNGSLTIVNIGPKQDGEGLLAAPSQPVQGSLF